MEKPSFLHGRLKEGTIWKENSIQSNGKKKKKKKKGKSKVSPIFEESRTSTDLSLPSIKSTTRMKKKNKKGRLSNMSMNSNEVNLINELGKRKNIKKSLISNGNEDGSSSINKSIMNLPYRNQLYTQSSENQSNSLLSSISTNKSMKNTKKKKKKVLSRHSKFRKISAKSKSVKVGNYQKKVLFIGKIRNEGWFKRLLTPSSKIG